jgi:hypothetical protein
MLPACAAFFADRDGLRHTVVSATACIEVARVYE